MTRVLALLIAFAVAACGTRPVTVPVVRVERITPPIELLTCLDEPPVPATLRTVQDLALHHVDVAEAGQSCRSRLEAVKQWVEAGE